MANGRRNCGRLHVLGKRDIGGTITIAGILERYVRSNGPNLLLKGHVVEETGDLNLTTGLPDLEEFCRGFEEYINANEGHGVRLRVVYEPPGPQGAKGIADGHVTSMLNANIELRAKTETLLAQLQESRTRSETLEAKVRVLEMAQSDGFTDEESQHLRRMIEDPFKISTVARGLQDYHRKQQEIIIANSMRQFAGLISERPPYPRIESAVNARRWLRWGGFILQKAADLASTGSSALYDEWVGRLAAAEEEKEQHDKFLEGNNLTVPVKICLTTERPSILLPFFKEAPGAQGAMVLERLVHNAEVYKPTVDESYAMVQVSMDAGADVLRRHVYRAFNDTKVATALSPEILLVDFYDDVMRSESVLRPSLRERIVFRLRERGFANLNDAARAAGVTASTIYSYGYGSKHVPRGKIAEGLAKVLGISVKELHCWIRDSRSPDLFMHHDVFGDTQPKPPKAPIGQYLLEVILERGYPNVNAFCESNGFSHSSMVDTMSGLSIPKQKKIERLATALRIGIDELVVLLPYKK